MAFSSSRCRDFQMLDGIAPGTGSTLASVPGINDLKFQLMLTPGGSYGGQYPNGQTNDNCFLGAYSTSGSITGGLKATAKVDFSDNINAGVYFGGSGTFSAEICPEFTFSGFSGKVYGGSFAQFYCFKTNVEFATEIAWDFTGEAESLPGSRDMVFLNDTSPNPKWQPIGQSNLKWGRQNRLSSYQKTARKRDYRESKSFELETTGTSEETLIENVTWVADPTIVCNGTESRILYALFDDQKPWHQISDLGEVIQIDLDPWTPARITDDDAAEFSPEVTRVDNNTLLAAWSRVDGDVSGTTEPDELAPYLEVVTALYDKTADTWSSPVQITTNSQTDREPLPVIFGEHIGLLWVQNQGDAMTGNSTFGDSLLYSEWNGTAWETPVTIWSGQKGIASFSSTTDAQSECHVVLCVDEDGDNETDTDLELYLAATSGGVWQAATRMTNDGVEDKIPVLVAPEGVPILVWSADLTLTYTLLSSWNPKVVYSEETLTGKAPSLDGIGFPGGAAIAYSAQHPDGVDLFAAFYDVALDTWSLPRRLTEDEDGESSVSMAFDGAELVLAYLKTQTLFEDMEVEINGQMEIIEDVPQPGRTDLCSLRHRMGHDLTVVADSIVLDPADPVPGETVLIQATVMNDGELPAQNLPVQFYDGDPETGGTLIGEVVMRNLIAGSSQVAQMSWGVPDDGTSHAVYVTVDPALSYDDRNRANNTVSSWFLMPDLTVTSSQARQLSKNEAVITSRIENIGVITSRPVTVEWHLGSVDGELIGTKAVQAMPPESVQEMTLVWDATDYLSGEDTFVIYTVVDVGEVLTESDEENNSSFAGVKMGEIVVSDPPNKGFLPAIIELLL